MTSDTLLSIFLGIGLSASVGFRVFLPMFALSLAAYFNLWELNESWLWLGSTMTVITLGIATIVEVAAYYIPVIDNALDAIAIPLATIAGTAVMVSTVADLSPLDTWALAIIAGGGTAAAIKTSASTTRLGSTVSTAGFGNPIITTIETVIAFVMSVVSIFLPIVAIFLVFLILYFVVKLFKKLKSNKSKST